MATKVVFSAAGILGTTGAAKVWSSFGGMKVLAVADPLTGLAFGHLLLVVGLVELGIAGFCLLGKSVKAKLFLIAWLATNFVIYRIGLWAVGWREPCSCLGNLSDALHVSPKTADTAMKIVLAYLLIGSYASLVWLWKSRKSEFELVVEQNHGG